MDGKDSRPRWMILVIASLVRLSSASATLATALLIPVVLLALALAVLFLTCLVVAAKARIIRSLAAIGTAILCGAAYLAIYKGRREFEAFVVPGETIMLFSSTMHAVSRRVRHTRRSVQNGLTKTYYFWKNSRRKP